MAYNSVMAVIFDGKKFAQEREEILKKRVEGLKIKPRLASVLVGSNPASVLYINLKKRAASRVGVEFVVFKLKGGVGGGEVIKLIEKLNLDKKVNGIMVQLPLPLSLRGRTRSILNTIDPQKDVDGLTKSSSFMPAAVRAVKSILEFATKDLAYFGKKAGVVGAKGMVGEKVCLMLEEKGYKVTRCDKETRDLYAKLNGVDLVIGVTGVPGLIKGEMIKEGCIAIDVGSPKGDFDKSVFGRAGFVTPVPGGVGPVTILCLFENLVEVML